MATAHTLKAVLLVLLLLASSADAADRAFYRKTHDGNLLPDHQATPGAIVHHDLATICNTKWGQDARAPFRRDGWVFEEKVDGWRMLAYKDCAHGRLVSRNGVDHTRRYPDVVAAVARLRPTTLVLDGELAMFDGEVRGPAAASGGASEPR